MLWKEYADSWSFMRVPLLHRGPKGILSVGRSLERFECRHKMTAPLCAADFYNECPNFCGLSGVLRRKRKTNNVLFTQIKCERKKKQFTNKLHISCEKFNDSWLLQLHFEVTCLSTLLYERVYFATTFCNLLRDAAAGKLIFNILNNLIVSPPHEGIKGITGTYSGLCHEFSKSERRVNGIFAWMNEWMNECVYIYRTYHIVSQGGLQFHLSEIGR